MTKHDYNLYVCKLHRHGFLSMHNLMCLLKRNNNKRPVNVSMIR